MSRLAVGGNRIASVSIIVPVYNVEEYLDRCLKSITNQTYPNIEIVLINDGSTDNSGIKCEEWAEKDDRIVYITQENQGLSTTRNLGVDTASAEFVAF